jgi:hypothetical protein
MDRPIKLLNFGQGASHRSISAYLVVEESSGRQVVAMKKILLVVAAVATLPVAADARTYRRQDDPDRGQRQALIACTVVGCVPVPSGCGRIAGRTRSGAPSGFDVIVCPPGVQPLR